MALAKKRVTNEKASDITEIDISLILSIHYDTGEVSFAIHSIPIGGQTLILFPEIPP